MRQKDQSDAQTGAPAVQTGDDGRVPAANARLADVRLADVRLADALLVRRVQTGDTPAFGELVVKYQDRVFNACLRITSRREDAADLTQDAFLKAFAAIGEFRGASAFYTWVFRIVVNLAISHERKRRLRAGVSLDGAPDDADGALTDLLADHREADSSAGVEAQDTRDEVTAALASLDSEHRVAVVLRDIEGCDYQEIADILELPIGTVKSRIFRGRSALRELLAPKPRRTRRARTKKKT